MTGWRGMSLTALSGATALPFSRRPRSASTVTVVASADAPLVIPSRIAFGQFFIAVHSCR